MPVRLPDNSYELDLGIVLTLARARRRTIHCHAACLWITQTGLNRDIILAAGQSYAIERAGQVAIQALEGRARFSISTAPGRLQSLCAAWRSCWRRLCCEPRTPWSLACATTEDGSSALRPPLGSPRNQG